jgi:hypothetical protein
VLLYFGGDEMFASKSMKAIQGYHLITPGDRPNYEQH